jgi:hypothetical protein
VKIRVIVRIRRDEFDVPPQDRIVEDDLVPATAHSTETGPKLSNCTVVSQGHELEIDAIQNELHDLGEEFFMKAIDKGGVHDHGALKSLQSRKCGLRQAR